VKAVTEAEWLACTDPKPMLEFLRGKASDRKLRLFACACCRRVWHLLADERSREAIRIAERFADGDSSSDELEATYRPAVAACHEAEGGAHFAAAGTAERSATDAARYAAYGVGAGLRPWPGLWGVELKAVEEAHASLVREVFGNPFRPVTTSSSSQSPQVVALAQAAYDERELPAGTLDLARLAVLADALEEAGCTAQTILDHLRGPGPHVRGCWAVDLILGKE
jgi:hypothetical protein